MSRSICIVNGHPDNSPGHFVPALADAYEQGAREAGHAVSRIDIGSLPVEFLHNQAEFDTPPCEVIAAEREKIAAADHLVLIYPLWMGAMPAMTKAFLEQVGRGGFFVDTGGDSSKWPVQRLKGKSVRIVVTMGMPGLAYRLMFGAHSLKGLEKGVFSISGFRPVRHTVLGSVEAAGAQGRARMLYRVGEMGRKGH
jgi:putative NADPH-quinone reductase